MTQTYINPKTLPDTTPFGFSQIVTSTGSRMVHLSGQVGWDAEMQMAGSDLKSQIWQSLKNIQIAMEAAGGSLTDVVSMRIYIVESAKAERNAVTEGLLAFFPHDRLPATTWLIVSGLANDNFLIEFEALGVLE